jgi:hypothetical protein
MIDVKEVSLLRIEAGAGERRSVDLLCTLNLEHSKIMMAEAGLAVRQIILPYPAKPFRHHACNLIPGALSKFLRQPAHGAPPLYVMDTGALDAPKVQ